MADVALDVLVLGAGPGGYVAAIRAAQLGFAVGCVDKEARFGGTCLRVGCIPSKALLDASERYFAVKNHYAGMGIRVAEVGVDVGAMMARKEKVVGTLTGGIDGLFRKNKVMKLVGKARFVAADTVEISGADGKTQTVVAKHVVIATGSVPVELPFLKFDGKKVISSDQALALEKVPGSMVVIGGGAIGLELGSVWGRLGAKVTVLEMMGQVVAGGGAGGGGADGEMARGLEKVLKKQGIGVYTGAKVTGAEVKGRSSEFLVSSSESGGGEEGERGRQGEGQTGDKETGREGDKGGVKVRFEWEGKSMEEEAEVVLVAVGRRAYTEGLGLEKIGVKVDGRGRVEVDGRYRTNVTWDGGGVYAIGDVIAGPMLAHKAEEEGIACVELMAGKAGHVNYGVIPGVVYTMPELAWVGRTEEQCQLDGLTYKVGKFQFRANGRALAMDEAEGFVKVIADAKTDRVLGVHILGAQAGTMIAEACAVMEFAGTAEDLGRICHAHPTLPEAVKEAALAALGRAIHA